MGLQKLLGVGGAGITPALAIIMSRPEKLKLSEMARRMALREEERSHCISLNDPFSGLREESRQ